MKMPARLITTTITLALYLLGTVGIGIYYCSCKNEKQLALFEQQVCACKHEQPISSQQTCTESKSCCGHNDQKAEQTSVENKGCEACQCNMVKVVSLDSNQLAAEALTTKLISQWVSVIGMPLTHIGLSLVPTVNQPTDESPPGVFPNKPSIYQTRQLRL